MSRIDEVIKELKLTKEQLKDKKIMNFVLQVAYRKQTGKWIQGWNGNGYVELNIENGTSIRTVLDDKPYVAEFPENIDMEISNRCTNGCSFCYAGCTPNGKHADIKKFLDDKNSFLYTLRPGTELALNGNSPLHPNLESLLKFCKERNIFANLTVQENTLLEYKNQLEDWLNNGYIHGIGISPCSYSDEMIEFAKNHSTAVIHTIAGITTPEQYYMMKDFDLKILILGYKDFGRGVSYKEHFDKTIQNNIDWLKLNVREFPKQFKVVSFDNLAIQQLDPKSWIGEKWDKFYRGNDGSHTMFIDLVNETYAKNSMQDKKNHTPLTNDICVMLKDIQSKKENN